MNFKKEFRVYFGDTDAAGVVHHAKYIYWLEAARIDMLDAIGCSYKSLQDRQIGLVPVDISIQYKAPLKFDDRFYIELTPTSIKRASILLQGNVYLNSNLCASSVVTLACINEKTWKPMPLPQELKNAFNRADSAT